MDPWCDVVVDWFLVYVRVECDKCKRQVGYTIEGRLVVHYDAGLLFLLFGEVTSAFGFKSW